MWSFYNTQQSPTLHLSDSPWCYRLRKQKIEKKKYRKVTNFLIDWSKFLLTLFCQRGNNITSYHVENFLVPWNGIAFCMLHNFLSNIFYYVYTQFRDTFNFSLLIIYCCVVTWESFCYNVAVFGVYFFLHLLFRFLYRV